MTKGQAMLKEKDNRIEQLENINKFQSKDIGKAVDYTFELNKEIEEKDKIIDLMANHIATSDSDLCEYLDITTKCKYYAGDNGKTCDNCIKQYFENKARENPH